MNGEECAEFEVHFKHISGRPVDWHSGTMSNIVRPIDGTLLVIKACSIYNVSSPSYNLPLLYIVKFTRQLVAH